MFVVVVEYIVKPEHLEAFREKVVRQAADTVETEPGCRSFDVSVDPVRDERIVLYEVYDDREAFEAHRETAHSKAYFAAITDMVDSGTVGHYLRLYPA